MKLTEVSSLPKRAAIKAAAVGTFYFYRRLLFVWPEPFGFVYLKVGPNAWLRAGGRGETVEQLVERLASSTEIESLTDGTVATKLVASEVDADKGESHHGLFRGDVELSANLKEARAKEERALAARDAAIAAHDPKRCDSVTSVKRLKELLTSIETLAATRDPDYVARRGATLPQLAQLERAVGGVLPKDLVALYTWADGNGAVSLFTIDDVVGQLDLPGLAADELPIIEIGDGDCFVYVVRGRERGIIRTYYNDAEHRAPGFPSLVAWAESVVEKLAPTQPAQPKPTPTRTPTRSKAKPKPKAKAKAKASRKR